MTGRHVMEFAFVEMKKSLGNYSDVISMQQACKCAQDKITKQYQNCIPCKIAMFPRSQCGGNWDLGWRSTLHTANTMQLHTVCSLQQNLGLKFCNVWTSSGITKQLTCNMLPWLWFDLNVHNWRGLHLNVTQKNNCSIAMPPAARHDFWVLFACEFSVAYMRFEQIELPEKPQDNFLW